MKVVIYKFSQSAIIEAMKTKYCVVLWLRQVQSNLRIPIPISGTYNRKSSVKIRD